MSATSDNTTYAGEGLRPGADGVLRADAACSRSGVGKPAPASKPAGAKGRLATASAEPTALASIVGQPQVRSFLAAAVREGRLSHAYLFLGAPGSGQAEAAQALAECLVCPTGGCDACDECIRVVHRTHPDVHWIAPEGASGYVAEQVRSLIADVSLAPVRSNAKVYILERVETLRDTSANALLKTIEEPPEGVVFILMARSADVVLPTIVSRCQCVPFRVSDPADAARRVARRCGVAEDDPAARIALAVAGTPERACDFLRSPRRREARRTMVRAIDELPRDDAWDVLCAARSVVEAVSDKPAGGKKSKQPSPEEEEREAQAAVEAEFLSPKAMKLVEQRAKRELTARERSGMMEVLAAAESLLRDVLMRLEDPSAAPVNADAAEVVGRIAERATTAGVIEALGAVRRARDDISHNVTPQLALEVMLCSCKEALCPPSYR